MNETTHLSSSSKRKIGAFVTLLILLIGGLSAFWFWAAGKLDTMATTFTNNLQAQGKVLKCAEQDVRGYPFRLGLFCKSVSYADPISGITISGNALRSAAQLYQPGHLVAELDAPFDMTVPNLAPLTLNWRNLRSSSNVGTAGLKRLSVVADNVSISANDFGKPDLLGSIDSLEMHARPSASGHVGDLELALLADEWRVDNNGEDTIEAVDISILADILEGLSVIQSGQDLRRHIMTNGGKIIVNDLRLKTETGGMISIRGPLEIGTNGLVSGSIALDFDDPQKLVRYTTKVFPPAGEMLGEVSQYLDAFADKSGKTIKIRDLKLKINDGKIMMGFFQIGEIPRLF